MLFCVQFFELCIHRLKSFHDGIFGQFFPMHGIFYAEGPGLVAGTHLNTFENINIHPFILKLLGFKTTPNSVDGRLKYTEAALRK